jgi:hypothetical protein
VRVDGAIQRGIVLAGLVVLGGACSDALEETASADDVIVVVNAVSDSLSLLTVRQQGVSVVAVPPPGAMPGSIAVLGSLVAVPGGDSAELTVFGFDNGEPATDTTVRLAPAGVTSGVTFESDSIVWIANPQANTVTRLDVHTGGTTIYPTGADPQAVVVVNRTVYVLNANAPNGVPAGPSWLTVLSPYGPQPGIADSTPLTGTNARFATLGDDGFLYVVESGTPGLGDGKLSIVDTVAHREQVVLNGLGESPGPLVYHPTGRILVASATDGLLEINTTTRTLVRGPGNGVSPSGAGFAALTLDPSGRIYAVDQGNCTAPGVLYVLSPPPGYNVISQVPVGVCPVAAATVLVP